MISKSFFSQHQFSSLFKKNAQSATNFSSENSLCVPTIRSTSELDLIFKRLKTLGEGTYGIVYEAIHVPTGRRVALKKIRISNTHERELTGIPTTALREVILLKEVQHPNIVELLHVANIGSQLWLCFELCDLDLRQYMKQKQIKKKNKENDKYFLPIQQCKLLTRQLFEGVAYCHSKRLIHRDLKPQNILLNKHGTLLKIADFGLARSFTSPTQQNTHEVVTLWYRAPELLLGDEHYTSALDVWSAGCIVAEIASGKPLFHGDSEIDTLFRIFRVLGTPVEPLFDDNEEHGDFAYWAGVSNLQYYHKSFPKWTHNSTDGLLDAIHVNDPLLIDFLNKIFKYSSAQRLTALEALRHPWLAE